MVDRLILSALGFSILFLSACAKQEEVQPIPINISPVAKPELVLPYADPLNLRSVNWIIVTDENIEEIQEKLQSNEFVLFALTRDGYENLSLNLGDLRAYIQQQNAIIIAYENYYVQSDNAIDAINSQINTIRN